MKQILTIIVNIPKDKLLHLLAGIIISQIVCGVYTLIFHPSYGGAIAGFVASIIAGGAKEIYDAMHKETHCFELLDLAYTTLGGLVGTLLVLFYLL